MDTHALLAETAARLSDAGARDELLVRMVEPRVMGLRRVIGQCRMIGLRRVLGLGRRPALEPVERVWRLGVLLLGRTGALYATGSTLRVAQPRHPNAQSLLAESRREVSVMALRAGIPAGETIDVGAHDIHLDRLGPDDRPLARIDGRLRVQWSAASEILRPLEEYLAERVALLLDPPEGA